MKTKAKETDKRPKLSASMIEDDATERLKRRARDLGLIVNAGAGKPKKSPPKKGGKK
jgi:hypothetical protein